jgi:hypothetical protein
MLSSRAQAYALSQPDPNDYTALRAVPEQLYAYDPVTAPV